MSYLKNLSSSEVFDDVAPWDFTALDRVPQECFADKKARDRWINNPETEYHVYSMFEGVQKNVRVRSSKKDGDDNEPRIMTGLAVDYDCRMTLEQVKAKLPTMGEKLPTEFEQTLSGNGRLVYRFQTPLVLPSRSFALHLLKDAQDFFPLGVFPGLDEGALLAPERYFTNGGRWTKLQPWPIPTALLRGWMIRLIESFNFNRREFGKAINLKAIEEECRRRYPRFAEWEGDFSYGSQGPTFWVEGSKSPKSAIVKETGCHTFSETAQRAGKGFYSWAEIVGAEFVENTDKKTVGAATENVFYDGQSYFFHDGMGRFQAYNPDITKKLLASRGLRTRIPKGEEQSEVDKATLFIAMNQRIDVAASCAFYPKGIFNYNGKKILNLHQIDAMTPAPESATWGETGRFPFLSQFFDGFFLPKEIQLERFLAWYQRIYKSCLNRTPVSGHALIIAGPPNCGKTFLTRGVVGRSLGGFSEPNSYILGEDNFNSQHFDYALWTIDDATAISSERIRNFLSERLKQMVANRDHSINEKYRKGGMIPWQGRIGVTCNNDAESLRIVPNLDINNRDKLMLFQAGPPSVVFKSQPEMEILLDVELPHFLRWLHDWTPPSHCFEGADERFGITAYCHPALERAANQSSGQANFVEILTAWLIKYFTEYERGAAYWEGTTTDLRIAMMADPIYTELLRGYKPEQISRILAASSNRNTLKIEIFDENEQGRLFRIHRDPKKFGKLKLPDPVPQAENSDFEKK